MKNIFEVKEENTNRETVYYWMNKYISLLEKYNELLLKEAEEKSDFDQSDFSPNHPTLKKTR